MQNKNIKANLVIERPLYTLEELNEITEYKRDKTEFKKLIKNRWNDFRFLQLLFGLFPIMHWLSFYDWKKDIMSDIVSGLTVGVMHITQGIGYALLGNVPPVVGVYTAFVPVLVYVIFGTSRHISIGTFAIVCLMTGTIVQDHTNAVKLQNGTVVPAKGFENNKTLYTNIEVAISVCFIVSVYQMCMLILRLSLLTTLFSESLVSGFTSGAAMHVLCSQFKEFFGIPIKQRSGYFKVALTLMDVIQTINRANYVVVIISTINLTILILSELYFKPLLAKKTYIPLPVELFLVICGSAISYGFDLNQKQGVNVVKFIPTGIPTPVVPPLNLVKEVALESIAVSVVSYSVVISMAYLLAQKGHYDVNADQELFALSLSNFSGSFFSSLPVSGSLSRSLLQFNTGGVTQMAGVMSSTFLFFVLLWIGPLFEPLPLSILTCIIIVALKGMYKQILDLKKFWLVNKWDGLTWTISFCVTVIVDITIGLTAGLTTNFLSILVREYRGFYCLLGNVPDTDLYVNLKNHKKSIEFEGIKIFRFSNSINFCTKLRFRKKLYESVGLNPIRILENQIIRKKKEEDFFEDLGVFCIIIDLSSTPYVDPSAVSILHHCVLDYKKIGVYVYLAAVNDDVLEVLQKFIKYKNADADFLIFASIHDAVIYAQAILFQEKNTT